MKRFKLSDQVVDILSSRIRSGLYQPTQSLPSTAVLAQELEVGRSTIREALSQLELMGLIEVRHGKGIFVAEPKIDFSSRVTSFSEIIRQQGMKPSARVLHKSIEKADQKIAEKLQIQPGELVNYLVRLRLADGLPVAVENSYSRVERFPGLIESPHLEGSLYEILRDVYHCEVAFAVRTVEAILTTPEETHLLDLPARQPALRIETIALDANQRPVDVGHSVYRADRFKFVVHQTR